MLKIIWIRWQFSVKLWMWIDALSCPTKIWIFKQNQDFKNYFFRKLHRKLVFLQNNIKHQLVAIFKEKSLDLQNLFRYCIMPCIVFAYFIHVCIYHLDTNVTKSPFFISKLCFEVDEFFSGSTDWKSIAFVEFEHSPEMKENKKSHTKKQCLVSWVLTKK